MSKPTATAALLMVFVSTLAVPATAAEVKPAPTPIAEIAEVSVSPTHIDWLPAVDAERWVLTLAGPGDLFIRRPIESGKTPSLSLFDADGERLPDGSYAWELQGISRADTGKTSKLLGTGRLPQKPLVQSGRFAIQAGSFQAAPEEIGVDAPQTPTKIIAKTGTSNLVVNGFACIGDSCTSLSDPDFSVLKLKSMHPDIRFDDIGDAESGRSPHDWGVVINNSGTAQFSIVDIDSTTIPFNILAGAPDNSLFVNAAGKVGIGTASPSSTLHVKRSDGTASLQVRETSGTAALRVLQTLENNGGVQINVIDDSAFGGAGVSWALQNVNAQFRITDVGDATNEMILDQAGNVTFAGTVTPSSSRTVKEEFSPIDSREVLRRVLELPITTWSYKSTPKVRHVGPMSEDFFSAFHVGADDKGISVTDSAGVALAAVQGLHLELAARDAEIAALKARLAELAARLEKLETTR